MDSLAQIFAKRTALLVSSSVPRLSVQAGSRTSQGGEDSDKEKEKVKGRY